MRTKKSYGIVCYQDTKKGRKFLLIKKRYTYAFMEFVTRFSDYSYPQLCTLLNGTTNEEKTNIRSLNYKYLWQIVLGAESNTNSQRFRDLEQQFRLRFSQDIIDRLLANTSNVDIHWDIPRGRKKRGEKELDCAFREFQEETGIPPTDYSILNPDFFITHKIATRTATYVNIYYPAKMRESSKHLDRTMKYYLPCDFNEIQSTRWVNFNQIDSFINPNIKYIFTSVNNG